MARTVTSALVACACVCGIFLASKTFADQFNDQYYIEPGGQPDLTEEGKQSESKSNPPPDSGSGGGGGGGGSTSGGGASSGGGGSSSGDDDDEELEGDGADGSSETGSGVGSEEEALETLLGQGAINGTGIGSGAGGASGSSVSIDGKKVRAAARKDPDVDAVLRYWKLGKYSKGKDKTKGRLNPVEYYALVASTLAADDERLEGAEFSSGQFTVTYRSRGALLWFIPISFPVQLTVHADVSGVRADVKLPWYRLFVQEYFTRQSLALEVEGIVQVELEKDDVEDDLQARVFEAVAQFLRKKVRTISDSIFLG